eukprot:s294_g25.t1
MVQVCLTSGEEVLRQEGVATLRELHLQLGATGPASSVPTFLREDGHVLEEDDVAVEDEALTLVWVEWWHSFNIRKQSPSRFQRFLPRDEHFNVGLLEMALLAELKGGENGNMIIDYSRALQADIELAILNVLNHFRPESPILRAVRDFTAFIVAYLPSELSSVLGILLDAAIEDIEHLTELRRFGFGDHFTATLALVEETVKHLLSSLESELGETKEHTEMIPIVFKSDPPKTIHVQRAWREEAYVYFQKLQPKLLRFLQLRDQLAFAGKAHEIDGWLNLHRPFTHAANHYQRDHRFSGLWAL